MTARRPILLLSLCGLLSLAIYIGAFAIPYNLYPLARAGSLADIGRISGYSSWACALYVGSIVVLFALYLWGIALAREMKGWRTGLLVFIVGLVAAVILMQVYPYSATDVFLYIVRGRVLGIYGQNSMVVPPDHFSTAPYLPFSSEWAAIPSPYGSLWEWTAAGLARLGDGSLLSSLLAFKSFALLSYLSCGCLVIAILRAQHGNNPIPGLLAFAWNPLVLIETHAMAHNDLYMILFVLLAVWCWERERYSWVLVALILGGLIKYAPFLLLPPTLVLMKRRLSWGAWGRAVLIGGLISLCFVGLTLWPLWPGWDRLDVTQQMSRLHTSVATWVVVVLLKLVPQAPVLDIGLWLMRALLALSYLVLLIRTARGAESLARTYYDFLYIWLVLGAAAFGYWYIAWLIAIIPLISGRRIWWQAIFFACCGILSVAIYTFGVQIEFWIVYMIAVPFTFALPYLLSYGFMRLFPDAAR